MYSLAGSFCYYYFIIYQSITLIDWVNKVFRGQYGSFKRTESHPGAHFLLIVVIDSKYNIKVSIFGRFADLILFKFLAIFCSISLQLSRLPFS